jgi:hypothetical protein
MPQKKQNIDILENTLRQEGIILDILLLHCPSPKIIKLLKKKQIENINSTEKGHITRSRIIWATDAYEVEKYKKKAGTTPYGAKEPIQPELVTGKNGLLIQPRASKSKKEQLYRTKDKAEVFTPLDIVKQMNESVDTYTVNEDNWPDEYTWQDYVKELKLEITCGEGPFIVSRYDPTSQHGEIRPIEQRVGFLDMKLQVVNEYCKDEENWLYWAKEAFKASYGYEWQGDNVLLARENLLFTFIDYYEYQFGKKPDDELKKLEELKEEFAIIISWNIFQMDGLKYVIPMSCNHNTSTITPSENRIDGYTPEKVEKYECEGCKYNRPDKHNGKKYVKIMNWETGKPKKFITLLKEPSKKL